MHEYVKVSQLFLCVKLFALFFSLINDSYSVLLFTPKVSDSKEFFKLMLPNAVSA